MHIASLLLLTQLAIAIPVPLHNIAPTLNQHRSADINKIRALANGWEPNHAERDSSWKREEESPDGTRVTRVVRATDELLVRDDASDSVGITAADPDGTRVTREAGNPEPYADPDGTRVTKSRNVYATGEDPDGTRVTRRRVESERDGMPSAHFSSADPDGTRVTRRGGIPSSHLHAADPDGTRVTKRDGMPSAHLH